MFYWCVNFYSFYLITFILLVFVLFFYNVIYRNKINVLLISFFQDQQFTFTIHSVLHICFHLMVSGDIPFNKNYGGTWDRMQTKQGRTIRTPKGSKATFTIISITCVR